MARGAPPSSSSSATNICGGLDGRRILVVDDAHDLCRLYQTVLEANGASVTITTDGALGVELACTGDFDLVLMDLEMPKLPGLLAARQMRERGYNGMLIALSGHSDEGHISDARSAGYSDYLCKDVPPFQLAQLLATYLPTPNLPD
ncbi:MAG: hypothetical protein RL011_532 [Pseudomonadota bacterium]|jgi:CheY-like chemotaxis protein